MKKPLLSPLWVLIFAIACLFSSPLHAATFTVNSTIDAIDANAGDGVCETAPGNGECTPRAAVQETNALAGADAITLPAGTFTLSIAGTDEDAAGTGDLDITQDLTINGSGAVNTIIDGGGIDRIFDLTFFGTPVTVNITGVTIRNGNADEGGGISNFSGTLSITDSIINGNTATFGAGVASRRTLTLTGTTVSGNVGTHGGGIWSLSTGTVTIAHSTLSGNSASFGGGISSGGNLTVTDSTIAANNATFGGGVHSQGTQNTLVITTSAISNNAAIGSGGGVWSSSSTGSASVTNTTISGNEASGGETPQGGGIFNSSGALNLTSSTVADNSADSLGGGIFNSSGAVTLGNSIVANSPADGNCAGAAIASLGHNLDSGNTCGFTESGDLSNTDPMLGPLANNGGPTFTHGLLPDSPAIDGGDNASCPAIDQRGFPRPVDGDGDGTNICDIGAYEISAAQGLNLLEIRPNKGGDTGTVSVTIHGSGFAEGAMVKLVRAGESNIVADPVSVSEDGRTIATTFDLTGKARGLWDVVVTNPDGEEFTLPEGFTIEEGSSPQVWVDIVGRSVIRAGREQTYTLFYGNRGNVDTFDVMLLVRIPAELEFKINIPPPNLPGVDWEGIPQGAIVGSETVIPIWIYAVPALSSQSFSLSVQAPLQQGELKVRAEVLQSEPTQFTRTGEFAFVGGSSAFFAAAVAYSFLPIIDPEAPPVEEFAIGLHTWLQNNQEEIKLVPFCSLSIAAATGVLGRPITNPKALGILCDPFMPTVSSTPSLSSSLSLIRFLDEPFYGNYCGPGWRDHNGNEKRDEDPIVDLNGQLDLLDADCKEHDNAFKDKGTFTFQDLLPVIVGMWNVNVFPGQDNADDALCASAKDFDPSTSSLGSRDAKNVKRGVMFIFCDQEDLSPLDIPNHNLKTLLELSIPALAPLCLAGQVTKEIVSQIVFAIDPNDKVGSQGSGTARHLSGEEPLRYAIYFENVETATAPAQEVVITDQLDLAKLDLSTFSLGPITFGNNQLVPPPGTKEYTAEVLIPGQVLPNIFVQVRASLDVDTGLTTWRFTSIDPATGQLPEDPLEGFLPPNVTPPEGDGNVLFTVMAKAGLPTGTEVQNSATIVFDTNPPIDTPVWFNTLDNDKPQSRVEPLAATQTSTSLEISWSGTDVGAGVKDFTIFVSEDGGAFTPFLTNTPDTSAVFTGQAGKTYAFYSIARDQTNNLEDAPASADATTQIVIDQNQPPVADAGTDETVRLGSLVTLDGSASSDPDGGPNPLSFLWAQTAGPVVALTGKTTASPTFTPNEKGSYTLSLVVNDGQSDSAADNITITVPTLGDIDLDGDVDKDDLRLIRAAKGEPADGPNDLRDLNGDGKITSRDVRKARRLCTRRACRTG